MLVCCNVYSMSILMQFTLSEWFGRQAKSLVFGVAFRTDSFTRFIFFFSRPYDPIYSLRIWLNESKQLLNIFYSWAIWFLFQAYYTQWIDSYFCLSFAFYLSHKWNIIVSSKIRLILTFLYFFEFSFRLMCFCIFDIWIYVKTYVECIKQHQTLDMCASQHTSQKCMKYSNINIEAFGMKLWNSYHHFIESFWFFFSLKCPQNECFHHTNSMSFQHTQLVDGTMEIKIGLYSLNRTVSFVIESQVQ